MPTIDRDSPRPFVRVVEVSMNEETQDSVVQNPEDDDSYAATYTDYKVHMRYEEDRHVYMMGNTMPGSSDSPTSVTQTVSFVQLANTTILWVVDWTASRWRKKPKIPNPNQPADSGWVLLKRHYEPGLVTAGPDGTSLLYRISGTYWYGHRYPDPTESIYDMNFAAVPWLDNTVPYVQDRNLDVTMYEDDIINVSNPVSPV